MPWLADFDVSAAQGSVRRITGARTESELRRRALDELGALVPADVLSWERVPLAERRGRMGPERLPYAVAIGLRAGRDEAIVAGLGRAERTFSARDRDVLGLVRPGLEAALHATEARGRLVRALAERPPVGTAVVLLDRGGEIEQSSPEAERWLAEHFGAAEHPGWLPRPVAEWLALPPRPPLVAESGGRRLTVRLLPGDPHALLLEEEVTSFRAAALNRLGLTAREVEVLRAAAVMADAAEIADELFLSLHAVHERLTRLESKLEVQSAAAAVVRVRREST
jgi:DNA-binding CsgD family transcriptional regulator